MPTGTRSSISVNSVTKPTMATRPALIAPASLNGPRRIGGRGNRLWMEDQPVGAQGDQQHGRRIADPGDGEGWPGREAQRERADVGLIGTDHLVEQAVG